MAQSNKIPILRYISTDIRKTYKGIIDSLGLHGKTLKTDTWNEVNTEYPIKADKYIELDKARVRLAKEMGYDAVVGDIRDMPFEDEEFDNIIDLSTIDHVPDFKPVLKEYYRVLKEDGLLVVVVWLGDRKRREEDWGGYQYWFNEEDFLKDNPFNLEGESPYLLEDEGTYLKMFKFRK